MEALPNELYLSIFRYLHKFDLIYAFANLNQRLQQLIEPYLDEMNLTAPNGGSISYKYFQLFNENIVLLHGQHIRSMALSRSEQLQLLEMHFHRFLSLEELRISFDISQTSTFLQKALLCLPSLSKLCISSTASNSILQMISSYAQTRLNNVILCYWKGFKVFDDEIFSMPYIKHFSVTVQSVEILIKLFQIMPNLEELCLSVVEFTGFEDIPCVFDIPATLEKLHLEVGSYDYYNWQQPYNPQLQQIKQFVQLFKNRIRSLTLIAINIDDRNFSDPVTFQSLTEGLPYLEKFEYHISTIHQPDPAHFAHVKQSPDFTYTIYTVPAPRPFDHGSKRTIFARDMHIGLTLQELWNCRTLCVDSSNGPPSKTFEIISDSKFVNLRTLVMKDPVADIYLIHPKTRAFLKNMINLSPNLSNFDIQVAWEGTRSVIKQMYETFGPRNGHQIKYFRLSINSADDEKSYSFPELFSNLSSIFSNLRVLNLFVEQKQLNQCYKSIIELIEEMKTKLCRLIHLTLGMPLRDECDRNGFETYKTDLSELRNSLYYFVVHSHDTVYFLHLWL